MPKIPDSILDGTKKLLGIEWDYEQFDDDIIAHINSVFSNLHQLGVGTIEPFEIEDRNDLWSSFLGANKKINFVKTYMYLQVRMWFDTPTTSFDLAAKQAQIDELKWRLNAACEIFNPVVNGGTYSSAAFMWTLEGENIWPPEAETGDLGLYPPSGNVWRKQ